MRADSSTAGDPIESGIVLAFVGGPVPDAPPHNRAPFSRSGNNFATEFIRALGDAGLRASLVLSTPPLSSFRTSGVLFHRGEQLEVPGVGALRTYSFLNVTPVKQLMIGIEALVRLLAWSWRNRHRRRILCCYNLTTPPAVFMWLASRLGRLTWVGLLCDIDIPGETTKSTLWGRIDHWSQKQLIPRLHGLVVVTDAIAEDFGPGLPNLRVEGGVSASLARRFAEDVPKEADGFRVFFGGKLDELNGIDLILEAFERSHAPDMSLWVAGRGPLQDRVEAAASRDRRIHYLGFLDQEAVFSQMQQADLLLNVRRTQALNTRYFFPGKMMEYLVSGTPVISTLTGHTRKEYGDFIFPLEDESSTGLLRALEDIRRIEPGERRSMARRARRFMLETKSWPAQGRRLHRFMCTLVRPQAAATDTSPH